MLRQAVSMAMTAISAALFVVVIAASFNLSEAQGGGVNCQYWIDPATNEADCHGDCFGTQTCKEIVVDPNHAECRCDPPLPEPPPDEP
ncbi:hypothetical protein BH23PLA1_BH23PLA1_14420 [soil metagenome]